MFRMSGDDDHGECTLVKGIIDPNDTCNRWSGINKSITPKYSYEEIVSSLSKSKGSNADQMIWNQDHGQVPLKQQAKTMANSSKPTKKCDYCQRKSTKVFVVPGSTGAFARSCNIHAPSSKSGT